MVGPANTGRLRRPFVGRFRKKFSIHPYFIALLRTWKGGIMQCKIYYFKTYFTPFMVRPANTGRLRRPYKPSFIKNIFYKPFLKPRVENLDILPFHAYFH